jgi:hypothetical protein
MVQREREALLGPDEGLIGYKLRRPAAVRGVYQASAGAGRIPCSRTHLPSALAHATVPLSIGRLIGPIRL